MAHTNQLPQGRHQGAIGHAHNFVYRRLMNNQVIPNVPVFLNTYYPPNQPTMKRCFQLGRAVRQALEAWDSDKTVALVASGGLTHFVIEEDLDQHILDGLRTNDASRLTDLPDSRFNSGTSEIRNWIVLGGAMADDGLRMDLVNYVPCYRSEAGTGCAMTFARWR
jgi:3-O-methylgallate 3,4-dioxygenase